MRLGNKWSQGEKKMMEKGYTWWQTIFETLTAIGLMTLRGRVWEFLLQLLAAINHHHTSIKMDETLRWWPYLANPSVQMAIWCNFKQIREIWCMHRAKKPVCRVLPVHRVHSELHWTTSPSALRASSAPRHLFCAPCLPDFNQFHSKRALAHPIHFEMLLFDLGMQNWPWF